MDAFFAAVEQLDDLALRGKPVIVGGTSRRGVVATASYEARRFGVHSAMPTAEARKRCPQGIFLAPRFSRYQELSHLIMAVFDDFSPRVEPLSVDEAFLDMTGAERIFGPPAEMGNALRDRVRESTGGLTVSVGVSVSKYVAKVASDFRKPDGLTVVPPDEVLAFLHPLPVRAIWGVGPRTLERLEAMGLRSIGDVARAAPERLVAELGSLGEHIHQLARGRDDREVIPEREAKSIGAEMTLERDVVGARDIRRHLRRAADRVAPRLRAQSLRAGGVRVKLKTADFQLLTHQAPLDPPVETARALYDAACALLPRFDLRQPYRLVGLAAFRLESERVPVQGDLFADVAGEGSGSGASSRRRQAELERTMDLLRSRFGQDAVSRASDMNDPDPDDRGE